MGENIFKPYIWHICNGKSDRLFGLQKSLQDGDCSHGLKGHLLLGRKAMTNLDSLLKSRDNTLLTKVRLVKAMIFPVAMYGWKLNHKKAEHWRTDAFELWCWKSLESPLDCKIKPVNPKGNQPWMFTGRTDAEAEVTIFWPPDKQSRIIRKDPKDGKDSRQKKGTTKNEMVGWYHWLNGHEFEEAPGDGEGQGSLACCSSWGHKESDMTERLNNNNLEYIKNVYNNNKTTHFKNGHWTWIYISPQLHKHETSTWKDAQHHWPLGNANQDHNEISLDTNSDGYILKRGKKKKR